MPESRHVYCPKFENISRRHFHITYAEPSHMSLPIICHTDYVHMLHIHMLGLRNYVFTTTKNKHAHQPFRLIPQGAQSNCAHYAISQADDVESSLWTHFNRKTKDNSGIPTSWVDISSSMASGQKHTCGYMDTFWRILLRLWLRANYVTCVKVWVLLCEFVSLVWSFKWSEKKVNSQLKVVAQFSSFIMERSIYARSDERCLV